MQKATVSESQKALMVLAAVMAAGLLTIFVFAAQSKAEQGFLAVASVGALLAGASAFAGGTLGFLFGIPRTLQQEGSWPSSGTSMTSADLGVTGRRIDYRPNTNLEQISDWLTKILVGVGLTQLPAIRYGVMSITAFAAQGLGSQSHSQVFAFALLSYFGVSGFLFGYLWTRLVLAGALKAADQAAIGVLVEEVQKVTEKAEATERRLEDLKKQSELDAAALNLSYRQLNPSADLPQVTQDELDSAVALATAPVKVQTFNQAAQLRSDNWRDPKSKLRMELTIPIFRALIRSDTENRYHRNHAQLGYALKDKLQPDWVEAEKELTTAIGIRGAWQESGWLFYELNRAQSRIMLDPAFSQDLRSDPTRKNQILEDLCAAAHAPDLGKILRTDPAIRKWMDLNDVTEKDLRGTRPRRSAE